MNQAYSAAKTKFDCVNTQQFIYSALYFQVVYQMMTHIHSNLASIEGFIRKIYSHA